MAYESAPALAQLARAAQMIAPPGSLLPLRLLVDYKTADGSDRNIEMLSLAPWHMTTDRLIESIRRALAPGCTLSAIGSVDYDRPIYFRPGIIEETVRERGGSIQPGTDIEAALKACGFELLGMDEIRATWPERTRRREEGEQ